MVFEEMISGKAQNSEGYTFLSDIQSHKSLNSVVDNNICLLHMDQEVRKTFIPQPMVSYNTAQVVVDSNPVAVT